MTEKLLQWEKRRGYTDFTERSENLNDDITSKRIGPV
jgi:hypothetical protein